MSYSAFESAPVINGRSHDFWCQNLITKNILATVASFGSNSLLQGKGFLDALQEWETNLPLTLRQFKNGLLNLSSKFPEINCTIVLFLDKEVLLGVLGQGAIFIKRDKKSGWLMQKEGVILGKLKNHDRLLLFSGDWWKKLPKLYLISALTNSDIYDGAQDLLLNLHRQDLNTTASGLLVKISNNQNTAIKLSKFKSIRKLPQKIFSKIKLLYKPKIALLGFLLIALVVAIILGIYKNFQNQSQAKFSDKLNQISHAVSEGTNLIDLNPIRARELLAQAVADLKQEAQTKHTKEESKVIEDNLTKAIDGYERALNKFTITPEIFFDFNLVKQGAHAAGWFNFEDNLWITDKVNHLIYILNITKKSAKIFSGDEKLSQSISAVGTSQENYVLIDSIYQIGNDGKLKEVILKDEKWGNIVNMYFYGGNLYLLDTLNNQIWKYIRTETGFSEIRNYLTQDTQVDLASATKLAINGSVWVSGGTQMFKFAQGVKELWQIQGLPESLGDKLLIFTSDNVKNVYILDKLQNRIIQTDKDGAYLSQYAWKEKYEITDFMVSESLGKILLLVGDKIYSIEIK
ncbi:MAG: hypothetical protein UR52_C0017G0008 [Candidatus Gottesmanbacteria bacterium GW2011_GWA1_34_13]|uniref:Uncharacterized protein n=1 Tax=Candidatus Gottesmanbacteria bacterium GW2011_GWA1_34_13 TaxID=1618434 RepID=A0A0G0DU45_9BACT|nr:MAG: hypothetical protein UR52_C0017G0008 [Candidatus Gottesmanbacteria bacterium GW2011_GWA1_34_13]